MNWRLIGGLVALIIILAIMGPAGTAHFIKSIIEWLTNFVNAL